jgi:hypothetical protein
MLKPRDNNIVIVLSFIDPLNFGETWYIKNDIFSVNEIQSGKSLLAPEASQVNTKDLIVQITPTQLAIFFQNGFNPEVIDKLKKLVNKLFENNTTLQVIAIGANHSFESEDLANPSKTTTQLHSVPGIKLHELLKGDNMRYGSYISKDYLNTRLRIDIKPYMKDAKNKNNERLKVSFNYHKDLDNQNRMAEIYGFIDSLKEFRDYSIKTSEGIDNLIKE